MQNNTSHLAELSANIGDAAGEGAGVDAGALVANDPFVPID